MRPPVLEDMLHDDCWCLEDEAPYLDPDMIMRGGVVVGYVD